MADLEDTCQSQDIRADPGLGGKEGGGAVEDSRKNGSHIRRFRIGIPKTCSQPIGCIVN